MHALHHAHVASVLAYGCRHGARMQSLHARAISSAPPPPARVEAAACLAPSLGTRCSAAACARSARRQPLSADRLTADCNSSVTHDVPARPAGGRPLHGLPRRPPPPTALHHPACSSGASPAKLPSSSARHLHQQHPACSTSWLLAADRIARSSSRISIALAPRSPPHGPLHAPGPGRMVTNAAAPACSSAAAPPGARAAGRAVGAQPGSRIQAAQRQGAGQRLR